MKGISAVVATILLLLITIGLAATAYFYVSGLLTGKTAKVISLADATCSGGTITIVLSNDGTESIADSEIRVLVDNTDQSTGFVFNPLTIPSRSTAFATHSLPYATGTHTLLLISPSNSVRQQVTC